LFIYLFVYLFICVFICSFIFHKMRRGALTFASAYFTAASAPAASSTAHASWLRRLPVRAVLRQLGARIVVTARQLRNCHATNCATTNMMG
jgi:hypothetical protein